MFVHIVFVLIIYLESFSQKISGTTIRNEKRAAFSLSIPSKTAVDIVAPERDIPGRIAIA